MPTALPDVGFSVNSGPKAKESGHWPIAVTSVERSEKPEFRRATIDTDS
jgi:hypothetical protein